MNTPLDPLETRILACLVEKSMATPEYYPLTLNALTAACNQKSNRDPVMQISDSEALRSLNQLRDRLLASSVSMAGSRAPRYRHSLVETLLLTPPQMAILCELMLRGPQTLGELRTRASRMVNIPDTATVQALLQDLASRPDGALVTMLPRQTGRREDRYGHLLSGPPVFEPKATESANHEDEDTHPPEPSRLSLLEAKVAALEDELSRVNGKLAEFESQLK